MIENPRTTDKNMPTVDINMTFGPTDDPNRTPAPALARTTQPIQNAVTQRTTNLLSNAATSPDTNTHLAPANLGTTDPEPSPSTKVDIKTIEVTPRAQVIDQLRNLLEEIEKGTDYLEENNGHDLNFQVKVCDPDGKTYIVWYVIMQINEKQFLSAYYQEGHDNHPSKDLLSKARAVLAAHKKQPNPTTSQDRRTDRDAIARVQGRTSLALPTLGKLTRYFGNGNKEEMKCTQKPEEELAELIRILSEAHAELKIRIETTPIVEKKHIVASIGKIIIAHQQDVNPKPKTPSKKKKSWLTIPKFLKPKNENPHQTKKPTKITIGEIRISVNFDNQEDAFVLCPSAELNTLEQIQNGNTMKTIKFLQQLKDGMPAEKLVTPAT